MSRCEHAILNSTALLAVTDVQQLTTEREVDLYCKTREGEAKLSRAAHKLREKAEFASQMDLDAAKKGVVKMSKSDARARARLDFKTEMYMQNVQKVENSCSG